MRKFSQLSEAIVISHKTLKYTGNVVSKKTAHEKTLFIRMNKISKVAILQLVRSHQHAIM